MVKRLFKKLIKIGLIGVIIISIIDFNHFYNEFEAVMNYEDMLNLPNLNYLFIILPSIIALVLLSISFKPKKKTKKDKKPLKQNKDISKTVKFLTAINDIYNEYADQIQWEKEDLESMISYYNLLIKTKTEKGIPKKLQAWYNSLLRENNESEEWEW